MEEERRHASPEGLRSEKDAVSIVKHNENEKSTTKTTKQTIRVDRSKEAVRKHTPRQRG